VSEKGSSKGLECSYRFGKKSSICLSCSYRVGKVSIKDLEYSYRVGKEAVTAKMQLKCQKEKQQMPRNQL
jgi:hypothetical protein